jgi:hypothetical protein
MGKDFKRLTDFLVALGTEKVGHTQKNYLAHLIAIYRLMESCGCTDELCRAGMFHSIYGTQQFQTFALPLERRAEMRELIGERAERLAYLNCVMDRSTLDAAVEKGEPPFRIRERGSSIDVELTPEDFDDLCRVHLYDWLEQVTRSSLGWDYRRDAYRGMARRLGGPAEDMYKRVFAQEELVGRSGAIRR